MPERRRIRVLIADDHPVLRDGLASILQLRDDMELVGEAVDGADAIEKHRELRPDITLMDLQMPKIDGLAAIEAIRKENPSSRIIVLTTYAGDVQALRAIKAGAAAYLLKSGVRNELVEAIRSVHLGRRYIQSEVAEEIALHVTDDPLSEREIDVLRLVAAGAANKQIAHQLAISEETVKSHVKSIFAKLDVDDRTQAVVVAVKRGIIAF